MAADDVLMRGLRSTILNSRDSAIDLKIDAFGNDYVSLDLVRAVVHEASALTAKFHGKGQQIAIGAQFRGLSDSLDALYASAPWLREGE